MPVEAPQPLGAAADEARFLTKDLVWWNAVSGDVGAWQMIVQSSWQLRDRGPRGRHDVAYLELDRDLELPILAMRADLPTAQEELGLLGIGASTDDVPVLRHGRLAEATREVRTEVRSYS